VDLDASPVGAAAGAKGESTVHELTRTQRTIARRMAESRATVPDFELRAEVDMSETVALRNQLKEISEEPISYNDFIVKAAALALREFPRVNGAYRDGAIETFARVNVGHRRRRRGCARRANRVRRRHQVVERDRT